MPSPGTSLRADLALVVSLEQSSRTGVAAFGGYVYQLHQSAKAWMDLADGEQLRFEVVEDILRTDAKGEHHGVQVKGRSSTITLRSPEVRSAIRSVMSLQGQNPGASIKINLLTTSRVGMERWRRLGRPGIEAWQDAAAGSDDDLALQVRSAVVAVLKENASEGRPEDGGILALLERGSLTEFRERLLGRLSFTCGVERDIEERNREAAVALCRDLFPAPGTEHLAYDQLLVEIIATILRSPTRTVDRPGLLATLARATTVPTSPVTQAERLRASMEPLMVRRRAELEPEADHDELARTELGIDRRFQEREIDAAAASAEVAAVIERRRAGNAAMRAELLDGRRRLATSLSFAAYLELLQGRSGEAMTHFESGIAELQELGTDVQLGYLVAAVDALREVGKCRDAADLIARFEPKLVVDRTYAAFVDGLGSDPRPTPANWRPTLRAHAELELARALNFADQSELGPALRSAQEGRRLASAAGDAELVQDATFQIGDCERRMGGASASARLEEVAAGAVHGDRRRRTAAFALGALAHMDVGRGDTHQALARLRQATDLLRSYDPRDVVAIGIMQGDLAKALLKAGRLQEAGIEVSQALASLANRHPRCHAFALCTYGGILAASGHADDSRRAYRAAEMVADHVGDAEGLAMARTGLCALGAV